MLCIVLQKIIIDTVCWTRPIYNTVKPVLTFAPIVFVSKFWRQKETDCGGEFFFFFFSCLIWTVAVQWTASWCLCSRSWFIPTRRENQTCAWLENCGRCLEESVTLTHSLVPFLCLILFHMALCSKICMDLKLPYWGNAESVESFSS